MTVRHSFVKSSTQVRHLILRPVESASMTKSIDRSDWAPPDGAAADVLLPALYDVFCVYARATEVIKPVHALMINMKPFTAQQLPNTTVAKTPALQCQLSDAP